MQFLNLYRTFKTADQFIIHFISVAKEERELWSPMSEKHCCLQPMDQTHTHTYVHTHVRDTCSYTREIRNSKKRTVIGKSEGCFWRRKMAGVKMLDSAGAYYQLNIFMKVPWHRQRLREVIGREKETPHRGFPIVVSVANLYLYITVLVLNDCYFEREIYDVYINVYLYPSRMKSYSICASNY